MFCIRKVALIATVIFFLASCMHTPNNLHSESRVDNRAQAGTVLLSVNSTIPWQEVEGDLDPKFTLKSGDDAIKKVVATTANINAHVMKSLGAGLTIGLPQSIKSNIVNSVETQENDADSTTTTTKTKNNEKKSGTAPDLTSPTTPSALAAGISGVGEDGTPNNLHLDPFLQYKAAQSLYQSVKLLNREAKNAAIREGYVPHVVMMKLTNIIYQRDLPYDVHSTISFFFDSNLEKNIGKAFEKGTAKDFRMPYVIPILATDNLEKAVTNRATEIAKQVGFAINAMVGGAGLNAGINKSDQQLNAILANDFNSLLTVGRMSDNSLYVRIGAANQSTARYAMVGKTYDIAALVLVPKEYYLKKGKQSTISVISYNEFRDTDTGQILPNTPSDFFESRLDDAIAPLVSDDVLNDWNAKTTNQKFGIVAEMMTAIQSNSWSSFKTALTNAKIKSTTKPNIQWSFSTLTLARQKTLWSRLNAASTDSAYKSASVIIQPFKSISIPKQSAILRDFGDSGTQIVFRDVIGAFQGKISSRLEFKSGAVLPATNATYNESLNTLSLSFPSIKKFKLNPKGAVVKFKKPDCTWGNACSLDKIEHEYEIFHLPVAVKKPVPKFKFRQTLKVVLSDKGKGELSVYLEELKDDQVELTVVDGRILEAEDTKTSNKFTIDNQKITLSKAAGINLKLDNLRVGSKVKINVEGKKKDTITNKLKSTGTKTLEFSIIKAE